MATERRDLAVCGVILAGGLSRRMGGEPKGLIALDGRTMMGRVIELAAPQVDAVAVNANLPAEMFSEFNLPIVTDPIEGFVGPLAGVLAGMRWASAEHPDATDIATFPCDAPFMPSDCVEKLMSAREASNPARIALARSGGHWHPVVGLWPVALADDLEAALRDGVRKVLHWTDRHGVAGAEFDMLELGPRTVDPFFNANTPDDISEARALLAELAK